MCIAVYKPKGKKITRATLKECWKSNPDGGGYMFANNGNLRITKGFSSFKEMYKSFRKAENQYDTDFVLHFRIATSGGVSAKMCHPFLITNGLAVVHNGIFSDIVVPKNSVLSDTAIFVQDVLNKLPDGWLENKAELFLIKQYCTKNNSKLIFLDSSGESKIINEVDGIWDEGIWFSNSGYKQGYSYKFGFTEYTENIEQMDKCDICGTYHKPEDLEPDTQGNLVCVVCEYADRDAVYCPYCYSRITADSAACPICGEVLVDSDEFSKLIT